MSSGCQQGAYARLPLIWQLQCIYLFASTRLHGIQRDPLLCHASKDAEQGEICSNAPLLESIRCSNPRDPEPLLGCKPRGGQLNGPSVPSLKLHD